MQTQEGDSMRSGASDNVSGLKLIPVKELEWQWIFCRKSFKLDRRVILDVVKCHFKWHYKKSVKAREHTSAMIRLTAKVALKKMNNIILLLQI